MKFKIAFFLLIPFALTVQFCAIQSAESTPTLGSGESPSSPKPGSCYAKCLIYSKSDASAVSEWREVLCGDKVTSTTVRQIQEHLKKEGYSEEATDGEMNVRTKANLTKYQKDKGLPVGNLDFETLAALGIRY